MATVRTRISQANIATIKIASSDAIGKDMLRRGARVESAAKVRMASDPRRIATGRLRSSINTRPIRVRGFIGARIGTNVKYALFVHNGTRHMRANPYLRDGLKAART